jgi:hypothetical protein
MASREHLAAMLVRSPGPLSKVSQAVPKARKTHWFNMDNKSTHASERGKEFFKIERTKQESL